MFSEGGDVFPSPRGREASPLFNSPLKERGTKGVRLINNLTGRAVSELSLIIEFIPVAMVKPKSRNKGSGGISADDKILTSLFRPVLPVIL
ncbi:hypothetical protein ES703_75918 [subsurface metagenome]